MLQTERMRNKPIDPDMLPLAVLMTIGAGGHAMWDDIRIARAFNVPPSEARQVLNDLEDWGMIRADGRDNYSITYRGAKNLRVYLPGGIIPKA